MAVNPDELAGRFDAIAKDDPDIRIDVTRGAVGPDPDAPPAWTAMIAVGRGHPETTRRFRAAANDAVALFDPDARGDHVERWAALVFETVEELRAPDRLGYTIPNAAAASALAVRRLSTTAEIREWHRYEVFQDNPAALADAIRTILELPDQSYRRADVRRALANLWHCVPAECQASVGGFPSAKATWANLADMLASTPPADPPTAEPVPPPETKPRRSPPRSEAEILRDELQIGGYLAQHPDATRDQVAKETGIAAGNVSKSTAWETWKALRKEAQGKNRARGIGKTDAD